MLIAYPSVCISWKRSIWRTAGQGPCGGIDRFPSAAPLLHLPFGDSRSRVGCRAGLVASREDFSSGFGRRHHGIDSPRVLQEGERTIGIDRDHHRNQGVLFLLLGPGVECPAESMTLRPRRRSAGPSGARIRRTGPHQQFQASVDFLRRDIARSCSLACGAAFQSFAEPRCNCASELPSTCAIVLKASATRRCSSEKSGSTGRMNRRGLAEP